LESLRRTAPSVKIVVAVEPDDPQAVEIASEYDAHIAVCSAPRLGCANAWNTAFRASPDDDIYVIGSDDCIFKPKWLENSLKALQKLGGSGLVGFKSGYRREMSDHYLMTRDFIIEHHGGVAAIPHYTSWCLDDEAQLRAKRVKKLVRADNAVVVHTKTKYSDDEGYRMGRDLRDENKLLFGRRLMLGFPDDFEPIIK
jgi:glycosyltransferase involved in cell wall biosynthesis